MARNNTNGNGNGNGINTGINASINSSINQRGTRNNGRKNRTFVGNLFDMVSDSTRLVRDGIQTVQLGNVALNIAARNYAEQQVLDLLEERNKRKEYIAQNNLDAQEYEALLESYNLK